MANSKLYSVSLPNWAATLIGAVAQQFAYSESAVVKVVACEAIYSMLCQAKGRRGPADWQRSFRAFKGGRGRPNQEQAVFLRKLDVLSRDIERTLATAHRDADHRKILADMNTPNEYSGADLRSAPEIQSHPGMTTLLKAARMLTGAIEGIVNGTDPRSPTKGGPSLAERLQEDTSEDEAGEESGEEEEAREEEGEELDPGSTEEDEEPETDEGEEADEDESTYAEEEEDSLEPTDEGDPDDDDGDPDDDDGDPDDDDGDPDDDDGDPFAGLAKLPRKRK